MAIGILLFMMAIFFLGSKMNILQRYYELICYFDKVNGLRVGAPVQLAGINVGFIDSISFEDRTEEVDVMVSRVDQQLKKLPPLMKKKQVTVKVKAVMKIDRAYQERIRTDTVASIQTQGLLGDRMVFLTVGSQDARPLKSGEVVSQVIDPSGFNQLVYEGSELIQRAKSFLDNSTGFISNTDSFVTRLNTIMDQVIDGDGFAHEVFYNKEHQQAFSKLDEILGNFEKASVNFSQVSDKINTGKGTLGSLVNDDSLYQDIKMLLGKANRNKLIRSVIRYTLETKEKEQLK